ncbi:uncharacterized protein LOC141912307 [Tubulanus polymorphus]|uniref:uncharacterized protein LOC141912307 n=1 Tax=Tubulanus polymorphus TaxID=672921 RepID=UPI003DA5B7AE
MKFVFCLVLCVTALAVSEACSCDPTVDVSDYSRYDFVVRARVKRERVKNGMRKYVVKIKEIFEQPPNMVTYGGGGNKLNIYTNSESSLCGIRLTVGSLYVLGGSYDATNSRANIGSCQYYAQVS